MDTKPLSRNPDFVLCGFLEIPLTCLVGMIAGGAIVGVSTSFMYINSFNASYWYHLLAGNIIGGVIISTSTLLIIRKQYFSKQEVPFLNSSDLTPEPTVLMCYPPLVRELFIANGQLSFEHAKTKQENYVKIYEFANWFNKNQNYFLEMKGDPLSEEYHKKIAEKLCEVSAAVKKLPDDFEKQKTHLKRFFIEKSQIYFDSSFNNVLRGQTRAIKKEHFEKYIGNISCFLTEKLSEDKSEEQFFKSQLQTHWNLLLFGFSELTSSSQNL